MDFRVLSPLWAARNLCASGAWAAALLALAAPAGAGEICAAGAASCGLASDLTQDLSRRRVDRTLATDPAGDRIGRLNGDGVTDAALPFAMTPDGDNTNFRTSLTQWSSALSAADREKLEKAKEAAGDGTVLPRAIKPKPQQFDVWARGRRELFSEDGSVSKEGNAITTYVGADYRASRNFLIGGMVQLDDSRTNVLSAPEAVDGKAYMAGPYMAYRITPHVVVDAKAGFGGAEDSAIGESGNADLTTQRIMSETSVTGNWAWNQWQLSQSGGITYLDETSSHAASGVPGESVDIARFSAGPELKRHFDTGNGGSVEPFAFFKSSLDLDDSALGEPLAQNTVGGGVTLAKPDKYNIRASADYTDSSDAAAAPVATGRVEVKVPSSLFGF
jgi:hypothetical protein